MDWLKRLIQNVVKTGVVRATQANKMQGVSVETQVDHDAAEIQHYEPFGFTSHPKAKAEAIVLDVRGTDQSICIMVADSRYRLTTLDEGEVALYNEAGSVVKLGATSIDITAVGDVSVTCSGDASVDASGDVLFGGSTGLPTEKVIIGTALQAADAGLAVAGNTYAGAGP